MGDGSDLSRPGRDLNDGTGIGNGDVSLAARTSIAREIVDRGLADESVLRIYETLRTRFAVLNSDTSRFEVFTLCGMVLWQIFPRCNRSGGAARAVAGHFSPSSGRLFQGA
jgi:hypothetical protein